MWKELSSTTVSFCHFFHTARFLGIWLIDLPSHPIMDQSSTTIFFLTLRKGLRLLALSLFHHLDEHPKTLRISNKNFMCGFQLNRMCMFGRLQRRSPEAPVRTRIISRIESTRRGRGQLRLTWEEALKTDLKEWNISKELAFAITYQNHDLKNSVLELFCSSIILMILAEKQRRNREHLWWNCIPYIVMNSYLLHFSVMGIYTLLSCIVPLKPRI